MSHSVNFKDCGLEKYFVSDSSDLKRVQNVTTNSFYFLVEGEGRLQMERPPHPGCDLSTQSNRCPKSQVIKQ